MRLVRTLPLLPAFILLAAAPAATLAPLARADAARSPTMDVDDIKVGMKGYGLTVFQGTSPEKFDVEVVGILHKFRPDQDLVLIKTPHERLNIAHTVAGMSGSPIYLDGKMIGAYAYGWQFGSEPIAGVTPIKNMLQDLARPVPPNMLLPIPVPPVPRPGPVIRVGAAKGRARHASSEGPSNDFEGAVDTYDLRAHGKQLGERAAASLSAPSGSNLLPASTMVSLGGLGDRSARLVGEMLAPLGFESLQGGGAGTKQDPNAPTAFVDGGAVGVQLIRGDISAMGLGTVTRVEGQKLVAFGHPMQNGGISSMPTAIGKIQWILASSMRSFKIGEAVRPIGTLVNDRQSSIVVDSSVTAPTFPVTVNVEGVEGAPKKSWSMELAHDRFTSPLFVGVAMGNTVESTVSERRDATWEATTKISVKNYGSFEVHDFGIAIGGTPNADDFVRSRATRALGMILNNPWEYAQIERVDMKMKISWSRDLLSLRGAHALEDTVDAGGKVTIEVKLWQFNGPDETRTFDVEVPRSFAGHDLDIALLPGWMDSPELPNPESLATLIANIPQSSFRPDSLIAVYRLPESGLTYKGQIARRVPASAADTLKPASDSDSPDSIPALVRKSIDMGHFIEGREHVRVHVRENLK